MNTNELQSLIDKKAEEELNHSLKMAVEKLFKTIDELNGRTRSAKYCIQPNKGDSIETTRQHLPYQLRQALYLEMISGYKTKRTADFRTKVEGLVGYLTSDSSSDQDSPPHEDQL